MLDRIAELEGMAEAQLQKDVSFPDEKRLIALTRTNLQQARLAEFERCRMGGADVTELTETVDEALDRGRAGIYAGHGGDGEGRFGGG